MISSQRADSDYFLSEIGFGEWMENFFRAMLCSVVDAQ